MATNKLVMDFQAGDCAVLALRLHMSYGWRLVLLCDGECGEYSVLAADGEAQIPTLPGSPKHVLASPVPDRLVDAAGTHPRDDLSWLAEADLHLTDPVVVDVSRETVEALITRNAFRRRDEAVEKAKHVAAAIHGLEKGGSAYTSNDVANAAYPAKG